MKSIASHGLTPAVTPAAGGHNQALRYLLIGGAASAIDVLTFLLLFNVLHTSEFMAHSISVPLAPPGSARAKPGNHLRAVRSGFR